MSLSPAILATLQLGAGIFEAVSQTDEAEVSAVSQEFEAGAEIFNADIARKESQLAQAKAKIEIGRKRKAQERLVSKQQALFAASGVRIDVGTPLIVMQDTLEETELDILITQFNADVASERLESEARQAEFRAQQKRSVAKQERTAGRIRAGKTLLETFSTFAQKFPSTEEGAYRFGTGAKASSGGVSAITGKGYGLAG